MTKAPLRLSVRLILSLVIPSLLLSMVLTGCGGNSKSAPASPTVSITANPTSIAAGGSSTLTVSSTNATQVTLTGSDGSTHALSASGGSQLVSPAATTTYTATATGATGTKASATATVTVTAVLTTTVSITAAPPSIGPGASSTLTVIATNATAVTVAGSDGSSFSLPVTGGPQVVSPTVTTTYTATATGAAGKVTDSTTVTVTTASAATVTILANPTTIVTGAMSTLTVVAANATAVTVTGSDGTTQSLQPGGGTEAVSPTVTTTYTASATGAGGIASATAVVTVVPVGSLESIGHVIFMLQENHTFDNYFGMLNPYRNTKGWNIGDDGKDYQIDGIDDKLKTISNMDDEGKSYSLFNLATTCLDDESSDWLASYGDVDRYDFSGTRAISMDGFVHNAEGYANSCTKAGGGGTCSGSFTDLTGHGAMGYYDENTLNYYYYMASQFALSDRWFSPVSTKSIGNRIATFTGGTTQGLVKDPGGDDHLSGQLIIPTIFEELDKAKISWKIYYTVTEGFCLHTDDCSGSSNAEYPATTFSSLNYSYQYLYENPKGLGCVAPTVGSSAVGDDTNSFCIDPTHIAPLISPGLVAPVSDYFTDIQNGTLPSFAFIEAGYGNNDEHPGSGQSVLLGQAQVANILDSLMASPSWNNSVFFFSYDEGGGPYDHVPPVPYSSNLNTDASLGTIPDIAQIAVNADSYKPCVPTDTASLVHCDLVSTDPGANSKDAASIDGFKAQLGFRLPNFIVSPFSRKHYVSHTPMDHTAIIKFVENRFLGPNVNLTARDAAQPNLLEFFDFTNHPWLTPPTPPAPITSQTLRNACAPESVLP